LGEKAKSRQNQHSIPTTKLMLTMTKRRQRLPIQPTTLKESIKLSRIKASKKNNTDKIANNNIKNDKEGIEV
jgi:hypothetical protein